MPSMRHTTVHRYLALAYVAAVTAVLLALLAEQTSGGPAALPGMVVHALAAGFGLEFVCSRWATERDSSADDRPLRP